MIYFLKLKKYYLRTPIYVIISIKSIKTPQQKAYMCRKNIFFPLSKQKPFIPGFIIDYKFKTCIVDFFT